MSKSLNKAILIGNLGADPEVRNTNSGTKVATLSVATSRQWKGKDGQMQEKTQWHRITCWNSSRGQQLADIAEKYCRKGEKVYIEGEIEYRTWEDNSGQKRYSTEINCRELILLGSGSGGGSRANAPARSGAAASSGESDDGGSFDDFPAALDAEDDDLPF